MESSRFTGGSDGDDRLRGRMVGRTQLRARARSFRPSIAGINGDSGKRQDERGKARLE